MPPPPPKPKPKPKPRPSDDENQSGEKEGNSTSRDQQQTTTTTTTKTTTTTTKTDADQQRSGTPQRGGRGETKSNGKEFYVDVVVEDAVGRPIFRFNGDRLRTMTVGHFKSLLRKNLAVQLEQSGGGDQIRSGSTSSNAISATQAAKFPLKLLGGQRMRSDYETLEEAVRVFPNDSTGTPTSSGDAASDITEHRSVSTAGSSHHPPPAFSEERLLRVYTQDPYLTVDLVDVSDFAQFQLHKLLPHTTIGQVRELFSHHRQAIFTSDLRALHTQPTNQTMTPSSKIRAQGILSEQTRLGQLRHPEDGSVIRLQTVMPTLVEARIDPHTYSAAYVREEADRRKKKEEEERKKKEQQQQATADGEGEEGKSRGAYLDPNDDVPNWDAESTAAVRKYKRLLQDMRENWRANDRFAYQLVETRYDLEDELAAVSEKLEGAVARVRKVTPGQDAMSQSLIQLQDELSRNHHNQTGPVSLESVREEAALARQRTDALMQKEYERRQRSLLERRMSGKEVGPIISTLQTTTTTTSSPFEKDRSAIGPLHHKSSQYQDSAAPPLSPSRYRGQPVLSSSNNNNRTQSAMMSAAATGYASPRSPMLEVSTIGAGSPRSATRTPRGLRVDGSGFTREDSTTMIAMGSGGVPPSMAPQVGNYQPLFHARPEIPHYSSRGPNFSQQHQNSSSGRPESYSSASGYQRPASSRNLPLVVDIRR